MRGAGPSWTSGARGAGAVQDTVEKAEIGWEISIAEAKSNLVAV
jgi:hypothetical protein